MRREARDDEAFDLLVRGSSGIFILYRTRAIISSEIGSPDRRVVVARNRLYHSRIYRPDGTDVVVLFWI